MRVNPERLMKEKNRVCQERRMAWAEICRTPGFEMNPNYIHIIKLKQTVGYFTIKKFDEYGLVLENYKA